jgi:hypothetical protein
MPLSQLPPLLSAEGVDPASLLVLCAATLAASTAATLRRQPGDDRQQEQRRFVQTRAGAPAVDTRTRLPPANARPCKKCQGTTKVGCSVCSMQVAVALTLV